MSGRWDSGCNVRSAAKAKSTRGTPMDAGNGKPCHFRLSQALANQVVRKAEISAPVVGGLLPVFHPLSWIAEIGQPVKVRTSVRRGELFLTLVLPNAKVSLFKVVSRWCHNRPGHKCPHRRGEPTTKHSTSDKWQPVRQDHRVSFGV